jgi:hypothetical protein
MRVGNIVEVLLSLLLTPVKNGRFKMTPKLRGIALLDSKFTDVSIWSFCMSEKSKISYQYLSELIRPSGHRPPYKVQSTTIRPCQS